MPIIYRSTKGSELTSDEVDGNFQFLDEEKQDNLTFDSTPTNGSLNPVTSDGIYDFVTSSLNGYLKKDGSVIATGNFNWNSFGISNLGDSSFVGNNSFGHTKRFYADPSTGTISEYIMSGSSVTTGFYNALRTYQIGTGSYASPEFQSYISFDKNGIYIQSTDTGTTNVASLTVVSDPANNRVIAQSSDKGFGIKTTNFIGYQKTNNLTVDRTVQWPDLSGVPLLETHTTSNSISLTSSSDAYLQGGDSYLSINDNNVYLHSHRSGANKYSLDLNPFSGFAKFTDYVGTGGLQYAADYSSGYTSRSLVDKAYVSSIASGVTSTTININGVSQDLSTNREWRTGLADTGVLTYAGASAASSTQINIGAATGWIIDNETNPAVPTKTYINYAGESNKTVTTLGSGLATYVLLNSSGVIVFQNTFPTSAQRKTHIYLSKVGHPSGSIITVGNEPDHVLSPISQLRNLTKYIGFVNNTVYASANGANLNINLSSGTVYRHNGNFVTDDTNPGDITVASATAASFLYRTQTGAGGGFVTAIDPTTYDNAGTSTAIGGSSNQATNQRIYLVPGLGLIIQKGQTIYTTLTDAIAAVNSESFVVYPSLINNAILIGVLSITKGCTALNSTTTARFFNTDKFGQVAGATAGISTATLQGAYNNSVEPEILTDSTRGAFSIKRGSGADTDNIFEGLNGSGTTTFSIDGNGAIPDDLFTLKDNSDGTKKLQFQLSGITTGTTRTITVPNASDTLAVLGTAQTFSASQTFSGLVGITNTTDSVTASSGSVQISGGVYIAKKLNIGTTVTSSGAQVNITDASGGGLPAQFISTSGTIAGIRVFNNITGNTSNQCIIDNLLNNSSGTALTAVRFNIVMNTITAGAEKSFLGFETYESGTRATRLSINGSAITAAGDFVVSDGKNIVLLTTTGTKIGTSTSQKLSFWNATPIVQPTTAISGASFTANAGTAVNDASTFDGYTIGQLVKALRNMGALA